MRLHLICVGTRMPDWVDEGYRFYARRLPGHWLRLVEVPLASRRAGKVESVRGLEGEKQLAAVPANARVVALAAAPVSWSTREVVSRLERWMMDGRDVALLVGGPDGLAPACLERAECRWSLSALTLPHGLVRVVVAEQIYRAWATLNHHPYHRG